MPRDLHHRRPTESDTPTNGPGKKHTWDNLALRERLAGLEVIHRRSVTSELHSAARLATEGNGLATEGNGLAVIPAAPLRDPRVARRDPWWKRLSTGSA